MVCLSYGAHGVNDVGAAVLSGSYSVITSCYATITTGVLAAIIGLGSFSRSRDCLVLKGCRGHVVHVFVTVIGGPSGWEAPISLAVSIFGLSHYGRVSRVVIAAIDLYAGPHSTDR